ncbi:hypothetical protein O181_028389 [Austropuccinia psidii MF-1]|uniref:Uncharacterized protein n=1 Tax=Austropuccinia psidii MF-1 TaxID=1389203 RepID=A0A9Q3CQK9_9BASI|nr:hypothetical protein [Austropuccinia psidii MF-1]
MVGSFSNLEKSKPSCLPPQAPISTEIHPPSLPYFTLRTIQDINNTKLESSASPPIIIEEEEEWEVPQILDSKLKRGKLSNQLYPPIDGLKGGWFLFQS